MRFILLVTILLSFYSCHSPLKAKDLQTWFYNLPVYENVSHIRAKLISDNRFNQQESTDATKQFYRYMGTVKKPYLPEGINKPDSSVIEFTYFDIDTIKHERKERSGRSIVKLFQVDYFYTSLDDIDELFDAAYDDLKVPFVKGHDIAIEHDGKEIAKGKNITYSMSKDFSQELEIVKRTHPNGLLSVRLVLMMGEK